MKYTFSAKGHPNIRAMHSTTLEFTKDPDVTLSGDCIVGVSADFQSAELRKFLTQVNITIRLRSGDLEEVIKAAPNQKFNDDHEMVIRLGKHDSKRTFGLGADRAASHLDRTFVETLKKGGNFTVTIT